MGDPQPTAGGDCMVYSGEGDAAPSAGADGWYVPWGILPGSGVKLRPSLPSGPEQDLPCCLLCFRFKSPPPLSLGPPLPPGTVNPNGCWESPSVGWAWPSDGAESIIPPAAGWLVRERQTPPPHKEPQKRPDCPCLSFPCQIMALWKAQGASLVLGAGPYQPGVSHE